MANMISFPLYSNRIVSNSPLFNQNTRNFHNSFVHERNLRRKTFAVNFGFSSRRRGLSVAPLCNARRSISGNDEEKQALETVLKLYSAIKNQNIHQVSNIIADECRCVCNFFSFFQSFHGKQQVLDLFKYVIRILGDNIEFAVKPTVHDGMNVGVSWRLQWSKTHMPVGKGFSFYVLQVYQGKVVIRNMEMFMEPLLYIQPFRLKITGYLRSIAEKMSSIRLSRDNVKTAILAVLLTAIILLFMMPRLN